MLLGSGYLHGMPRYIWRDVSVDVLRTDLFDKWRRHFQHFMLFPQLQRHFAAAYAMHEQARAGEGFDAVEVVDWGMLFMPWVLEASAPTLVQLHGSCGQIGMHDPRAGAESEDLLAILIEATVLAHAVASPRSGAGNPSQRPVPCGRSNPEMEGASGRVRRLGETWRKRPSTRLDRKGH